MNALAGIFSGGFVEPVFQSQETFRAVMNAMAMPGTIGQIIRAPEAPTLVNAATSSLLLTLCDYETPIWVSHSLAQKEIRDWIGFHAGAPLSDTHAQARFAFVANADELPAFSEFAHGTHEYPDRSATIILQVAALEGGGRLLLKGPGIKDRAIIAPQGLPQDFVSIWAANGVLFPRGIDLVLTCGAQFICLPRTVKIQEA
jgi:alpha-D-ribose 1-methylphosphonate 5-triphosphate synthase subunit PhnH